jgi:hypothetical protein
MKTLFTTVAAFATVGMLSVAHAQTVLDIDDDGFSFVPAPVSIGYTVDIDDDGWTRETFEARSDRGAASATTCSVLESTIGVSEAECGTMERSELVRMKFDADSND